MKNESDGHPIVVVGHKNPDTDSICSAIVYARFKSATTGLRAAAYRAGNLNEQTHFVLERFGVPSPALLTDVYPKARDIMVARDDLITVGPEDCLEVAHRLILEHRFAFLPVTDADGGVLGKITALRLADLPRTITEIAAGAALSFDVDHFVEISRARPLGQTPAPPPIFTGTVVVSPSEPVGNAPADGLVLIVPGSLDWREELERHLGGRIELVIVYGPPGVVPKQTASRPTGPPVILVGSGLVDVCTKIALSIPIRAFLDPPGPTFAPEDLVRNIQREVNKYNEGGFLVVDGENRLCGVITRVNFLNQARFRVVLVDHNEFSQAVDGMEHAEVVEVIDHHRIGTRATDSPITFINKVVGSTCTIIAEMYRNAHLEPDRQSAGLMLSALLSDTVILRSPTTTALDREMATWLSALTGVDIDSYGEEMFSAGSSLASREPKQIVAGDQKFYEESGVRFSVSQIEVVGFRAFHEVRPLLNQALGDFVAGSGCDFGCLMVTDITGETTLLLCAGDPRILATISYPEVEAATFEMRGVLSRKKQVVPYIVDLLRGQ